MTSFEHRKHYLDFAEEGTSGNSGSTKINTNFTLTAECHPEKTSTRLLNAFKNLLWH